MKKEWIITKLRCKTYEQRLINVVDRIEWKYKFTKTEEGKEYTTELEGFSDLTGPNQQLFIPFENLTKEQVDGWILSTIDPVYLKWLDDQLTNNINELISPTIVHLKPPF